MKIYFLMCCHGNNDIFWCFNDSTLTVKHILNEFADFSHYLRMLELKGGQVTLGANWEIWQKHYVLVYTLHTHAVSSMQCLLHMLWTSVYYETYTEGRNWSPVAETDTNSIFKILFSRFVTSITLHPLLVLSSSTLILVLINF